MRGRDSTVAPFGLSWPRALHAPPPSYGACPDRDAPPRPSATASSSPARSSWGARPLPRAAPPSAAPALTEATFEALRDAILPSAQERAFEAVGWRPSFGEAVREARELDRPVLLWAMNGHPLGCT